MNKSYFYSVSSETDDRFYVEGDCRYLSLSTEERNEIEKNICALEKKYGVSRPDDLEISVMRVD